MVDWAFTNEPIVILISAEENQLLCLLPAASLKTSAEPAIIVTAQNHQNVVQGNFPDLSSQRVGYKSSFQDTKKSAN